MKKFRNILFSVVLLSLFGIIVLFCGCNTKKEVFYNITYTASAGGYINGQTEQIITSGDNAEPVTAVPNEGYEFVKWSDGLTTPERQDRNVTEDKTVTAQFKTKTSVEPEPVNEYTITYTADVGGYIDGVAVQIVKENESAETVIAVPETGYRFVKWSDGKTTPERKDKNIIADKTVTAEFEKIKLNVTYNASTGGTIDGVAEQEIEYGNDAELVIAVPETGYKFVKWSDGNGSTIRKETTVTSEINVTAEFEFLYAGGNGSTSNPFLIETYTQLNDIWYYPESNYRQTTDLDLSGIKHEPIFDENIYFKGIFNGGGHTVKNLTVETELNYPSLFGVIDGGIISDLNFENANIKTTDFNTSGNNKYCVGIVAGKASGLIKNVRLCGKINIDSLSYDGVAIGGLIGLANGTFVNCFCDVQMNIKNVISEHPTYMHLPFVFGSLIGVGDSVFINNCNTEGQINIIECYGTDIITGGIIGYYITDRQVSANISNCKTEIEIYGDSYYEAGGFIGCVDINTRTSLSIVNCAVYGNIQIGTVGGFICRGFSYGELSIENCYVKNQITAYFRAAGFLERFTGNNNCKLNNCYAECKIITHRLGEPNIVAGESGGFSYQVSGINFIGCYSIFDINTLRGGGFSYYLSDCVLERCYSEGEFGLFNMKLNGLFTRGLIHTELWNCYIKSNINELQDKENIFVFTFLRNSYVTNFYYVGSDINNVLFRIENSDINNFHLLRSSSQEFNYVSQIIGEAPSTLDISVYVKPEDMYFLADKLNEGQDEEVWINIVNGLPKLKFEILADKSSSM